MQREKFSVYRSERINGEPRRVYVGSLNDPVTRILVDADRLQRATQTASQKAAADEAESYSRIEPALRLLATESNRLTRQLRFQRRQRKPKGYVKTQYENGIAMIETDTTEPRATITEDDFDELVENAATGDEAAVEDLRQALRGNAAIYETLGDLARHVQMALIDLAAPDSVAMRESVRLNLNCIRQDLRNEGCGTALEKLLVEQVVASMLDVSIQRVALAQDHPTEAQRKRCEKRLDRAQKRHLAALTALNEVRRVE